MMGYGGALMFGACVFVCAMVLVFAFLWRLFDVFPLPWRWRDAFKSWRYWVVDWARAKLRLPPL